ncbi:hypothetical protein R1sor_004080 [Riccia sorocarpa]|uniref:Protein DETOXIFICATION n=1 Tax=Riccia sorocarpa TaxID=122646 RepID=A0ABD3H3G7_9MARC
MAPWANETEPLTQPLILHDEDDRAPLLPKWNRGSDFWKLPEEKSDAFRTWLAEELFEQFRIAGPMILVSFLQYAVRVTSLMFAGHLGELALSSSQIAFTTAGATGFNVMMGLASALETLCGQAYGAQEYRLTGIFLQRAILVSIFIAIPISFVWWNMAPILIFMGQDLAISEGAQEYSRLLIPGLFAYAFLQPLVKFLQTQSAVNAMAVMSAITLVTHVPLCYLLIYHFGLGFRGAAIANGISQWINVLCLALYVNSSSTCKKTWTGFSRAAVHDIHLFLKIAVPSTIMTCLEYWCFDCVVLMSGLLANPQLETSSLSICINIGGLIYMVPSGLSAAASTRVSHKLGAGLPQAAKSLVKLVVILTIVEGFALSTLLMSVRNALPYLFSNDANIVSYASSMVPFLATLSILDACNATLSGVARGCGWQHLGAYSNLCAFYGIGIPMGLLMTFYFHLNSYGLWIGLICGVFTQAVLLSFITFTLNWQTLADEAAELVHEAKDHDEHCKAKTGRDLEVCKTPDICGSVAASYNECGFISTMNIPER